MTSEPPKLLPVSSLAAAIDETLEDDENGMMYHSDETKRLLASDRRAVADRIEWLFLNPNAKSVNECLKQLRDELAKAATEKRTF